MMDVEASIADGDPIAEQFLVDTGADCTVFSASLLASFASTAANLTVDSRLQGLGGESESFTLNATLKLTTNEGRELTIRGPFAAIKTPGALDVSILGRDVLANFDVIVSRRRNEVLLIAGNQSYTVTS